MKFTGRDDLPGLGKNQLHDIVKGQGDIDALGYSRQGIHFLNAPLQVSDSLYASNRDRGLVCQILEEGQVLRRVRPSG